MKNIKLILISFICLFLYIQLQSINAHASLQICNSNICLSNQKDSVKLLLYKIKNKDLMSIIDSFIIKWEKSPCYEPVYLNILTFPMKKDNKTFVKDQNIEKHSYWEISIKAFNYDNFRTSGIWGCFEYKKHFYILSGHPCDDFFSLQNTKQVFTCYPINNIEKYAFNSVMSWTYNYCDNHFILRYKRDCNIAY
jgi:hypothetical protein